MFEYMASYIPHDLKWDKIERMRHQITKQRKVQDYHDKNVLLTARLREAEQVNTQVKCQLQQAYQDIYDLKIMLKGLSNDASHLLIPQASSSSDSIGTG